MMADYAGTSPQVKQAINVVYNYTEAYTTFGLKWRWRRTCRTTRAASAR